jgi:hypothetical protein
MFLHLKTNLFQIVLFIVAQVYMNLKQELQLQAMFIHQKGLLFWCILGMNSHLQL